MSLILPQREGAITTITLNRPERRNAFTVAMLEALLASLELASQDGTRVILIRGADGAFSTGFDLAEAQSLEASARHGELLVRIQLLLAGADQVCIAAVCGFALAGGGAIVASCDYAVASEDAQFGYPVLKVGIVPTPGMPFLRHQLSDRHFRELVLGGELKDARWAEAAGLVNKAFPSFDEALSEAHRFAGLVVQGSPDAVRHTKRFANALTRASLREEMEESLRLFLEVRRGPQAQEGLSAFLEKRKPVWPT